MERVEEIRHPERRPAGRLAGLLLITAGALLIAVFGFDLFTGFGGGASGMTVAPEVGATAPNFTLRDIHGEQIALPVGNAVSAGAP